MQKENKIFTFKIFFLQGIGCILPIYKECILNGPPELRESGANGLNEAINLSE